MSSNTALVLETNAPLLFRALPENTAPLANRGWQANNLRVFQACSVLDDRPPAGRGEVDATVALALRRLDVKLTLLLELVGEWLASSQGSGPQRVDVEVDFRGVRWTPAESSLAAGMRGSLDLYIHPSVPRPLKFGGKIVAIETATRAARFEFDPLSELEGDQLERLIFRYHRRKVADARGIRGSSSY